MKESSKASERRSLEDWTYWDHIFRGPILDIGSGDDLYKWGSETVVPFDLPQDANKIDEYFQPASFQCVHGSQVMEHLHNPLDFLRRCLNLVPVGRYVVMTVPSELYEGNILPSKQNGDHKHTFSAISKTAPHRGSHIFIPTLAKQLAPHFVKCYLADRNYDYIAGTSFDQSYKFEDRREMWWELVILKT